MPNTPPPFLHDDPRRDAVALLVELRAEYTLDGPVLISGMVGPRGDGYRSSGRTDSLEAAAYHRPQLESFAEAGADLVSALTLTGPEEATGVVRAARAVGLPVAISFTVEADGRLPDGTPLDRAVAQVDAEGGPDWFLVNCAHPTHVVKALTDGPWRQRIVGLRPNASTLTHEQLDAADELAEGDLDLLAASFEALASTLPELRIVGGCCGTDVRHVARLWGV